MSTNRVTHIITSDESPANEQGEVKITGTTVGTKRGINTVLINEDPIPTNMTLDLTDEISDFPLYNLNEFQKGDLMYIGKTTATGKWLIQRFDKITGKMRYSNAGQNIPVGMTFSAAWDIRASLNYVLFHELTGV